MRISIILYDGDGDGDGLCCAVLRAECTSDPDPSEKPSHLDVSRLPCASRLEITDTLLPGARIELLGELGLANSPLLKPVRVGVTPPSDIVFVSLAGAEIASSSLCTVNVPSHWMWSCCRNFEFDRSLSSPRSISVGLNAPLGVFTSSCTRSSVSSLVTRLFLSCLPDPIVFSRGNKPKSGAVLQNL